jgi:uncharacterized membrane protein YczE
VIVRRLLNLYVGLILFGLSLGLMIESGLGLGPWDVFHQGLAQHLHLSFGWIVIAVSAVVLLAWIPLRQRPGVGTISNVVLVGAAADAALAVLPTPTALAARSAVLVAGIVLNAVATGMYVGAGLGPGPRDGLMTGLAQRGISIRLARTSIEVSVLGAGWLLGGAVGVGTVLYALSIGPLVQFYLSRLSTGEIPTTTEAP